MIEMMLSTDGENRTVDLPQQETLRVALPESPTTGYQWHIEIPNPRAVQLLTSDYAPDRETQVGGGGTRTFDLVAKSPGTTDVRFELRRGWQSSIAPTKTLQVSVNVK
jgi:predicted secreted protein